MVHCSKKYVRKEMKYTKTYSGSAIEVGKIISKLLQNRTGHSLKYNLLHGCRGGCNSMISTYVMGRGIRQRFIARGLH